MTDKGSDVVSAIVVNYNAGTALARCIQSLESEGVEEIIVVDNGSADGSCEPFVNTQVPTVLRPLKNLGFGGGTNFGAERAVGRFLLVCNADISVEKGAVDRLVSRMNTDPIIGLVGPALVTPGGVLRRSGGAFPSIQRSLPQAVLGVVAPHGRSSTRHVESNRSGRQSGFVDWVTGACMLVRREAFETVGGFDTRYFMYLEEVDLCWRLAESGWRTVYEPNARVIHEGGVSTSRRPYGMIVAHHMSLWHFTRRTTTGWWNLALPFIAVGIVLRLLAVSLNQLFRPHRKVSVAPS